MNPSEEHSVLTGYRPKRSFGQGNIFTSVCHSVHGGVPDQTPLGPSRYPPRTSQVPLQTRQVPPPQFRQVYPPRPGRYPPDQTPPRTRQVHPPDQAGTPPGVILSTGGYLTRHPPGTRQVPPPDQAVHLKDQTPSPRPGRYPPTPHPPGNSRLRNTGNVRPVRILLECILVCK